MGVRRLIVSSSQLSPCVQRTQRWYSVFLHEATLHSLVLFPGRRQAPKPVCGGCCVQHAAGPRFPFVRCLSTESGLQPRVRQQAVTIVSTGARRTGMIVCEAAGRRDTRAAIKQGKAQQSQTGRCYSVLRTATRSILILSPVLYIQVGILRTQDYWSFLNGTPQRPGHSLEHYTCSGRTNAAAKLTTLI